MREIIFRGKRMDNGEWTEGYLYEHEPALVGIVSEKDVPEPSKWFIVRTGFADWNMPRPVEFVEVDPSTVGQYTGLHDATKWENLPEKEQQEFFRIHKKEDWNGKKIFEGDILKWDSREWGCDHLDIANWDYELFNMRRTDWEEWCKVIGNIHDNPDLMLESKEEK